MDTLLGGLGLGWLLVSIILAIILTYKNFQGATIFTTGPGATFNLWWKYFVVYLVAIFYGGTFIVDLAISIIGAIWKWVLGGILVIVGVALLMQQEKADEDSDNSAVSMGSNKKYFGIGLLVIAGGLFISSMIGDSSRTGRPTTQITPSMQNTNTSNQSYKQSNQREAETSNNNSTTFQNQSTTSSTVNNNTLKPETYVSYKNQYDQEISALASDINAYLGSHENFRNENTFLPRAEQIKSRIQRVHTELSNGKMKNTEARWKLLDIFNAELGRVDGLIEGIRASKNGGEYTPGFKRGGEAYDRFEEANATLNNILR